MATYKKPKNKNKNNVPMWAVAVGLLAVYFALIDGKVVELKAELN